MDLVRDGYRPVEWTKETEWDARYVEDKMVCRRCGNSMRYEGWRRNGSYVALAICRACGHQEAF
jgi:hypothetical protein